MTNNQEATKLNKLQREDLTLDEFVKHIQDWHKYVCDVYFSERSDKGVTPEMIEYLHLIQNELVLRLTYSSL